MYKRPAYTRSRPTMGRAFGKDAQLVRFPTEGDDVGHRNEYGEWVDPAEPDPTAVRLATAPGENVTEIERRELADEGIRLAAARLFFMQDAPMALNAKHRGDIIVYPVGGTRWRVMKVAEYHTVARIIGQRIESQGLPDGTEAAVADPELADQLQMFERRVRRYIAFGSGLPNTHSIPAHDSGPAPDEPFCSVLFTHNDERSFPNYYEDDTRDADGLFHDLVDMTRDATVSIAWRRRGATARALRFAGWLETTQARETENAQGFRLLPPYQLREADKVVSDAWEETAIMDLHIGFGQQVDETIAPVESVVVTFDGDEGRWEQEIDYGSDA